MGVNTTLGKSVMTDLLDNLDTKLDKLLGLCQKLQQENQSFKKRESDWNRERSRLIEKNELARTRVEAMITRLKNLETDA
jgi:cell division protein ZapB